MTIYEVAIQLTQKHIGELTVADITEKYDGNIATATGALYEKVLANLLKEHGTTDQHKDIGVYVSAPFVDTVHFVDEDKIPD